MNVPATVTHRRVASAKPKTIAENTNQPALGEAARGQRGLA